MPAYACRISEENLPAIRSEHPRFSLEEIRAWMAQHGNGYFLRDQDSSLDCHYFEDTVFAEMYIFEGGDLDQLFRKVQKR
jgi:hypothetical protein